MVEDLAMLRKVLSPLFKPYWSYSILYHDYAGISYKRQQSNSRQQQGGSWWRSRDKTGSEGWKLVEITWEPWIFRSQKSVVTKLFLFSHSVVSDSLWPHGLQHARLSCPSLSPRVCWNSCPLNWWCHPNISSSVFPFSFCLQSFQATGSFPRSCLFIPGGQNSGASASASVLPMNIQGWLPLGLTGSIFLLCKGLSRVFSRTTVWKHQFFETQLSLWSNSYICTWLLEKP